MKRLLLASALFMSALPLTAGETGCIYDLKGSAEILKAGGKSWEKGMKGRPVAEGDKVRTGPGAWVEILFKEGSFIKLEENSEAGAESLKTTAQERVFSFSFLKGKALWMAARLKGRIASRFSVRSPTVVCAARGTDFSMIVSTSGKTTVGLFEGELALSGVAGDGTPPAEKELLAGGEASADAGGLTVEGRLSKLMRTEERRYSRVKNRVENLRKRLEARDDFIDDYINRQRKKVTDLRTRQQEKLKKR
ncbi:MAG: FecR domain-containing protein [Elusimicrobia bacterium]|nr:FecR domain-containing protein [Elusimicrobiota bacterium]